MDYKKPTKDQMVALLIEKDERLITLNSRLEKIEARLNSNAEAKFIERVVTLERSLYRQEQYSRRECIEIVGLPDSITDQAALEKKAVQVFRHAGVEVTERDFHAIHRLKKKSVVIAKCVNRRDATAILRAKKRLRETDDETKKKLGVAGKVFINESLCPEYRRLFGVCNALFKQKKLCSSYTYNGTIMVCKHDGDEKQSIGHLSDLKGIIGAEVVEGVIEDHKRKQ